jgi:hypothetical protein
MITIQQENYLILLLLILAEEFRGSLILKLVLRETNHEINLFTGNLRAVSGSFTFDDL